jgi:hypothetical protein
VPPGTASAGIRGHDMGLAMQIVWLEIFPANKIDRNTNKMLGSSRNGNP